MAYQLAIIGIALFLLLLSGAGLAWAIRGACVPGPPACRRCGYNLSGRAEDAKDCSECGADLSRPKAIVHYARRRRPIRAVVAGLGVLLFGFVFASAAATFPWSAWAASRMPDAWVQSLADRFRGRGGDAWRAEWRMRAGQSLAFYDHLLDLQGDTTIPFDERWDRVLATAYHGTPIDPQLKAAMESGSAVYDMYGQRLSADDPLPLTSEQRERYLRQMFFPRVTFRVRNPVRIGDPLIIWADSPTRGGQLIGRLKTTFAARVDKPAEFTDRLWSHGSFHQGAGYRIPFKRWGGDSLTPGPHKLHLGMRRELAEDFDKPISPPFDARDVLTIDVLPAGTPLGTARPDPAKASEVAASIWVGAYHWNDGRCCAEVRLDSSASADRAFTIYAVIAGEEKRIGSVAAKAGQDDTSNHVYVPLSVEQAKATEAMTFVVVGDGDALKETLDQQEYWPGRIVFPGVPLRPNSEAYDEAARLQNIPTYRIEAVE